MKTKKQIWLLTGGNGSGKSTFYAQYLQARGLPFVNADFIARDLVSERNEDMSYSASKIASRIRSDLIHKGVSFCFETVFSHPSKIDFVAEAKALGYEVILVFIHLDNSSLNLARVKTRVLSGGHDVPDEKVISRIPRTLNNIRIAMAIADETHFLDNSSFEQPFRRLATLKNGQLEKIQAEAPKWLRDVINDRE